MHPQSIQGLVARARKIKSQIKTPNLVITNTSQDTAANQKDSEVQHMVPFKRKASSGDYLSDLDQSYQNSQGKKKTLVKSASINLTAAFLFLQTKSFSSKAIWKDHTMIFNTNINIPAKIPTQGPSGGKEIMDQN